MRLPRGVNQVLPPDLTTGSVLEICAQHLPCTTRRSGTDGSYSTTAIDLPDEMTPQDADGWEIRGTLTADGEVYTATTRLRFVDEDGPCACDTASGTLDFGS